MVVFLFIMLILAILGITGSAKGYQYELSNRRYQKLLDEKREWYNRYTNMELEYELGDMLHEAAVNCYYDAAQGGFVCDEPPELEEALDEIFSDKTGEEIRNCFMKSSYDYSIEKYGDLRFLKDVILGGTEGKKHCLRILLAKRGYLYHGDLSTTNGLFFKRELPFPAWYCDPSTTIDKFAPSDGLRVTMWIRAWCAEQLNKQGISCKFVGQKYEPGSKTNHGPYWVLDDWMPGYEPKSE